MADHVADPPLGEELRELLVPARIRPYMPRYSVRVSEELDERIEAYTDEYGGSQSAALRELLRRGTEYEDIQRDRDRLRNAQTQLIEQREANQELVEYVEREKSMQERREERERKREERRNAPAWHRAKWWLLGRPEAEA